LKDLGLTSPHPPLAISAVIGGTMGTRPWKAAVAAITRRVNTLCTKYRSPLAVHVVFQVPGEVLRPDFAGVRTGVFSRREMSLVVQVAVPDNVDQDREEWLIAMLRRAVGEAERFAVSEALPDTDLSSLRTLVDSLSEAP
jgi:hypothetical protein